MHDSPAYIAELWTEFKENGDPDARQRLVLHYAPTVKFVAGRLASGLPDTIQLADLTSYGIFGLIDAIDKFDPARGFKFETYAMSRIRGAILDELRALDWAPRSVRTKRRRIQSAAATLEQRLRRRPDSKEIAAELGVTEKKLARNLGQIDSATILALDEPVSAGDDRGSGVTVGDMIADAAPDPGAVVESADMQRLIAEALGEMPERDRHVLTLYYYDGLTLAQIGDQLGVTESRVCQIHRKGLAWLHSQLSETVPPRGR